jgi:hypothetical protein
MQQISLTILQVFYNCLSSNNNFFTFTVFFFDNFFLLNVIPKVTFILKTESNIVLKNTSYPLFK